MSKKNSSGNITISLSKQDTQKLNSLSRAMATSRETVIRGLIREGYGYLVLMAKETQEKLREEATENIAKEAEPIV